jgi:high-affinity Fe2+/Pb2+ permease
MMYGGKIIAGLNVTLFIYCALVSAGINNDYICGSFFVITGLILAGLLFCSGIVLAGSWLFDKVHARNNTT